jgi:hypothetical protein
MLFAASSTPIICCTSGNEVKNAVSIFCREKDTVLELGAELGDVSTHLCRVIGAQGKAVLVDKTRSDATSGRCKHRTVEPFVSEEAKESFVDRVVLLNIDALSEWKDKIFVPASHYDIIIMSVAHLVGHDLYMTMLSLANEILNTVSQQPRAMIIKSKTLYSLSRRLVHSQRLFDGTTVLPPMQRSHEPSIIASVKVEEYRKTIPFVVRETDVILEVGSHFGRTTNLLNNAGRYCIGVDIGPKIINNAKKQYPGIHFAVGDAWRTLSLLKLRNSLAGDEELGYDLVYADIGGLSGSDGHLESLSLLDSLGHALEPRCIVIKSLCMRQLASRLKFFPDVWSKHEDSTAAAAVAATSNTSS